jgi:DNA-3-methyladenine glycosylase II
VRGEASASAALAASDPVMARLVARLGPIDLGRWRSRWSLTPFMGLARSIAGQQIAGAAAEAIFGRLAAWIGDRDPAEAIAAASDGDLRAVGMSAAKSRALRDLAERTLDGRLDLAGIDGLSDEDARAQLTAVRGIGPWTADIFLLAQLGRRDILPAGDLGIRNAVRVAYGLDHLPSEREVEAISRPWSPNRSLATAYLYNSLRPTGDRPDAQARRRAAPASP